MAPAPWCSQLYEGVSIHGLAVTTQLESALMKNAEHFKSTGDGQKVHRQR